MAKASQTLSLPKWLMGTLEEIAELRGIPIEEAVCDCLKLSPLILDADKLRMEKIRAQGVAAEILRPDEFIEKNSALFNKARFSYLATNRSRNGLERCGAIVKKGQRIFVNEKKFFQWYEESDVH